MRIILASPRAGGLTGFVEGLAAGGATVTTCASGEEAVAAAERNRPDLVVIDEDLPDVEPGRLVIALLQVDAGIATAVVSRLTDEEFHERSEGLGILARVPPEPTAADAASLLAALRALNP